MNATATLDNQAKDEAINLPTLSPVPSGLAAVKAIRPDVAIVHMQRSDSQGNAHVWGNLGVVRDACLASRKIIITVEELVDTEIIQSDPNRVLIPGFRVNAVVHCPWGAYPSPVPGYYNRDHHGFAAYRHHSRDADRFTRWRNGEFGLPGQFPVASTFGASRCLKRGDGNSITLILTSRRDE